MEDKQDKFEGIRKDNRISEQRFLEEYKFNQILEDNRLKEDFDKLPENIKPAVIECITDIWMIDELGSAIILEDNKNLGEHEDLKGSLEEGKRIVERHSRDWFQDSIVNIITISKSEDVLEIKRKEDLAYDSVHGYVTGIKRAGEAYSYGFKSINHSGNDEAKLNSVYEYIKNRYENSEHELTGEELNFSRDLDTLKEAKTKITPQTSNSAV